MRKLWLWVVLTVGTIGMLWSMATDDELDRREEKDEMERIRKAGL